MTESVSYDMLPNYMDTIEKLNEKNCFLIPLFSSMLCIKKLNIDTEHIRKLKNVEMKPTGVVTSTGCYTSTTVRVLDQYPEFRSYFIDAFNDYNQRILGHRQAQFDISTSWVTRVDQDGESQFHSHRNSYFSGVYYFDSIDKDLGGWLQIINQGLNKHDFYVGNIKDEDSTIFNADSYGVIPDQNLFIMFPSYLFHRVTAYHGKTSRYSLAMNFVPLPPYGNADSAILK